MKHYDSNTGGNKYLKWSKISCWSNKDGFEYFKWSKIPNILLMMKPRWGSDLDNLMPSFTPRWSDCRSFFHHKIVWIFTIYAHVHVLQDFSSQFLHFFHRFRGLKIRLRAGQSAIGRANVINAFFVFTFQSGDQNQIPSHPEGEVCLWIALCFIYNFVVISSNKSLSIIW